VKLAQVKMKTYYDQAHSVPANFAEATQAYLRLSKKHEKGYHLANQTKLSFTKAGLFKIIRPHGKLAYELELPSWLHSIHPVISVEYLEPAPPDLYGRQLPNPGPIHIDGEARYIIDKLVDVEVRKVPSYRKQPWYKIRWLGYDVSHDE
jgi:hypothetical protein